MTSSMREALIRPDAISHNVQAIRQATSAAKTLVVVKADGYGHGAVTAARAALEGGASWLGTADVDEAMELRSAGITAPVLAWLFGPNDDLSVALANSIDVGVSSQGQLARVISQASPEWRQGFTSKLTLALAEAAPPWISGGLCVRRLPPWSVRGQSG